MMRTALIAAILAVALVGNASQGKQNKKTPPANSSAPATATDASGKAAGGKDDAKSDGTQEFVIGAEDVLSVAVYPEVQFSVAGQSVRPDGFIAIPLVGDVKAMGRTPTQLGDDISKLLVEKYLRIPPTVTVTVGLVKSRYYSINGEVNKTGKFELLVPTTIMQALVNAGGFRDFANTKKITLMRDGKPFLIFNYNDAVKGKHPEKNVYLKHGDLIIVK